MIGARHLSTTLLLLLVIASAAPAAEPGPTVLAPAAAGLRSAVHATEIGGQCLFSSTTLCLDQRRFSVEVTWMDFEGASGPGRVLPFWSNDSGLFWFFAPGNWEMLVKVIDGCAVNDRLWVFAASATSVEFTLTVTDHTAGLVREYFKPLGNPAPAVTDTTAFPSCRPPGPPGLLVFANPSNIPVLGSTQITVIARDELGFPFGAGERIRLVPDLGTMDPAVVFTDLHGEATSLFEADRQPGTASVTAFADGSEPATVRFSVRDAATEISLQPNPIAIPQGDSIVHLLAYVSNGQGLPFQGQVVSFETEVGSFPDGDVAFTSSNGMAGVHLEVRQEQIPDGLDRFEVRAKTPSGNGQFIEDRRIILIR